MRRWLPGLFLALLLLLFSLPAAAQEECAFRGTLSAKEGRGGSTVDLTVYYDGSLGPLGSFVFWVDFDPQHLACQKVSLGEGLRGHYTLDDTVGDGQAAAVYTQKTADTAYGDAGEVLKCRFQVREGAPEGDGDFRLRTAQVYSPQGEPLCPDREEVLPFAVLGPVSSTAALLDLTPSQGALDQPFSPEQFFYTMTVPYEVKTLTFTATPAEGASCRVNRKNLGAGGSETEFQITVTAADGKTKQVYRVTVYRQEKEDNLESGTGEALLLSLVPETGQLDQAFSSDKLRYTMTVPFSVTAVTFQTQPAPGASCRVNRKNLGAGGSDTEFLFTVTAADGKTKQVYSVTVHREEKESSSASGKLSPSPGQSPAPSPSPPREGEDGPYPTSVPVPVEGEEGQEAALPEILVENQDRSLVYTLALAAFLVLLYVSGPVSRWIFQKKEKAGKDKK